MNKLTLMAGCAMLVVGQGGAYAADVTLRLGHVGDPGSLYEATAENFATCANDQLGDQAEIQVFGSSQLGSDEEMLQKLKLGQLAFSLPSTVMSSVSGTFGVFEMPYLIQSRDHMAKVRDNMGDVFLEAAASRGYHILGFWENGFRHITNNVRPVSTPDDLDGIKLRTPKGEWRVRMFQSYGANPTPMAFSEVFTALQTGVIDGQENPLAQIHSGKFQEVQKYLSTTGHVYSPAYLTTSQNQFEGWPEEIQAAVTACAEQAGAFAYEKSAELDQQLIDEIKAAGVEVNEPDKQAFVDASAAIYQEFGESVEGGTALIEKIQSYAQGS